MAEKGTELRGAAIKILNDWTGSFSSLMSIRLGASPPSDSRVLNTLKRAPPSFPRSFPENYGLNFAFRQLACLVRASAPRSCSPNFTDLFMTETRLVRSASRAVVGLPRNRIRSVALDSPHSGRLVSVEEVKLAQPSSPIEILGISAWGTAPCSESHFGLRRPFVLSVRPAPFPQ